MGYRVYHGLVAGRNHILEGRNGQDALCSIRFEFAGKPHIVGAVADGCGTGKYSEVGAQLAVQFIVREIPHLVHLGLPFEQILNHLFTHIIQFFNGIIGGYHFSNSKDVIAFINDHLLFTIVGFIIAPEETIIFAIGDGIIILNESTYLRKQGNAPQYIGYHLIDPIYLQGRTNSLPTKFDIYSIWTSQLHQLAIGSDAWFLEQELLDQVWALTSEISLQLQMNKWSDEKHFKDDAALIVVKCDCM